jgi:PAS domain S-box-containing protein
MAEENQFLHKIAQLEQELKALKEENELLTDRAEDFLLLGIISEKIGLAKSREEVIGITLESVSSLKDIHYSACLLRNNKHIKIINDYAPMLASSLKGQSFEMTDDIIHALQNDEFLFTCNGPHSVPAFIPEMVQDNHPKGYGMIPVQLPEEKDFSYIFLFAFYIQDMEYFQTILPLLCRVIEIACAKIESINLLQSINELNKSLEEKVTNKTKEIMHSNALLTSLVDSIPDLIFYKDQESRYLGCNIAFCRFADRSKAAIIGYTDFDFFDKELAEFFREKDLEMLTEGLPRRNEEWVCYPDGKKVLLDTLKTPYYGPKGDILGLIGISRDITEQHKTEKELLKVKKLESIGILAGGIAHDFNNILAAILGNINLARFDENLQDKTKQVLSGAEKACIRAKDLTQQLLTFAKGGEPVKETSSLVGVIKDSANFVLHGDKVACRFHVLEDLWLVEIDKGQISQVIQNIVLNASHAMPDGGTIQIYCENIDHLHSPSGFLPPAKKFVKVTITDSGIGISANDIDKIFDPYFSTKQDGSGLGLAISHSIITKHNGHISVKSTPHEGTTFTFYLPASEHRQLDEKKEENIAEATGKAKIMVMDDEEIVRDVVQSILGVMGHEVVLAQNGAEALDLYKEHKNAGGPIDIVIMDLTIPGGMGGKDAVQKILALDPDAKVIVSSGYSNDPIMANCREYGFCGAIVKPYQLKEFTKVINQVMAQ